MKLLLIEDDFDQAAAVRLAVELLDPSATLIHLANGATAMSVLSSERPNIVLLDLGLPGEHGLSVLQRIRRSSDVPVIVVSGRDNPNTVARALQLGADDYLVKPFYAIELQARIQAVTRRARSQDERMKSYRSEFVQIDFDRRSLLVQGTPAELSRQDWDILTFLWVNRHTVVNREVLRRAVWGGQEVPDATVSMAISRLRDALGPASGLVRSHRGTGYIFEPPAQPHS